MLSTAKNFSSRTSALVLGVAFGVSALVGGVSYAQGGIGAGGNTLTIPSDLSNAVIAIKEIILSPSGTSPSLDDGATIYIDGSQGSIITKGDIVTQGDSSVLSAPNGDIKASGNLEANGDLKILNDIYGSGTLTIDQETLLKGDLVVGGETLTLTQYECDLSQPMIGPGGPGRSEQPPQDNNVCVLITDEDGNVQVNGFLQTIDSNSEEIIQILGLDIWDYSNNANEHDIFFSNPAAGASASDILVRIGINKSGTASSTDAQLVVRNDIQSRKGFQILKQPGLHPVNSDPNDGLLASYNVGNNLSQSKITQSDNGEQMIISHTTASGGGGNIILQGRDNLNPTKVGINTDAPSAALEVKGNAIIDGSITANTYLYNSDRRYKSDIALLENSLDKITQLQGYSYFNKLSQKEDIGVIAQEVEKLFPALVATDANGYKSVAYANLIAPVIESVKALKMQLDTQQAHIESLEARLQALEAK